MSDQETYRGKLIPVVLNGLTIDEKIQKILKTNELESYYENWLEKLDDRYYKKYYYNERLDILFKVEAEGYDDQDFVKIDKNSDGSYDFITSFYNGGTYLNEMIDEGFNDLTNMEK